MFNFFKKKKNGPDFSEIDSRDKAEMVAKNGSLVSILMMPEAFGGIPGGQNVLFIPVWAGEQKERIDLETVLPLAQKRELTRYEAQPAYKGNSFVPSSITIRAHTPVDFSATIEIW